MSSVGLNKWIVSGNLAADAEVKTIELKSGGKAQVAEATLYVRKPRMRDESFTVRLTIWESSAAWRRLGFLKKGSLIICTGSVDVDAYVSRKDGKPKGQIEMSVLDIDLDIVKDEEAKAESRKVEIGKTEAIAF